MGGGASRPALEDGKQQQQQPSDKATASHPSDGGKGIVEKVTDKVTSVMEGDEDGVYEGFLVETNIKFDLSVPTNAVEGALVLVNVIAKLLLAYVNLNKFNKAMQTRVNAIEGAVTSLKQREEGTLRAALPALQNLVQILADFKKFVQHISKKPDGFFDKAISFFRAKSDLENLADFDKLFTRALADLQVPLQADQIALMEEQRTKLDKLSGDITKVLAKLDETKVLAISKRVLTYEESLTFWMECFPDKFQVPVKEFVVTLKVWFEECRGMQVNKRSIENIVASINLTEFVPDDEAAGGVLEDAADEFIDAREANLMFSALPDGYEKMPFSEISTIVSKVVREKREEDKRRLAEARESAAKKMMKIADNISEAEKRRVESFGSSLFRVRFLCEGTILRDGRPERRDDVNCAYITENGALHVLGRDNISQRECDWEGHVWDDLSCELYVENESDASTTQRCGGQFRGNILCGTTLQRGKLTVYYLRMNMFQWEGYYEYGSGTRGDMFIFMGDFDGSINGISDDEVGVAIWSGTISDTEFSVMKKYINQHFVEYKGTVKVNPNGLREVKGRWQIPGDWGGDFSLWEMKKA